MQKLDKRALFSGTIDVISGRLSNISAIELNCPPELLNPTNEWHKYVRILMDEGGHLDHWQWQAAHPKDRVAQQIIFFAIIGDYRLDRGKRAAMGGWLLSKMLKVVPADKH